MTGNVHVFLTRERTLKLLDQAREDKETYGSRGGLMSKIFTRQVLRAVYGHDL